MAYLLKRIEDMKEGEDVVAFAAHVVRWKSTAPGHFVLDGEATYAVVPAPAPSKEPGPSPCDFSPCVGQKCRISCDKCMTIIKQVRELDEKGWDGIIKSGMGSSKPFMLGNCKVCGKPMNRSNLIHADCEPAVLEARRGSETVGASSEARTPQPVPLPDRNTWCPRGHGAGTRGVDGKWHCPECHDIWEGPRVIGGQSAPQPVPECDVASWCERKKAGRFCATCPLRMLHGGGR